jgi:hypothetical protein
MGKPQLQPPIYLRNIEEGKKGKKSWYQYVFLGVARENETTTGRKREDLLAPRFPPGVTSGNSLYEETPTALDSTEPNPQRCVRPAAYVAHHEKA